MNDSIDYRPLAGMQHAVGTVFRAWVRRPLGLLIFIVLVVAVPIAGFAAKLFVAFFAGPIIFASLLMNRTGRYKSTLWEAFAAANGWSFDTTTSGSDLIPPSMQFGHNRTFSAIIQAQPGPIACDLFSYNTAVGSGRQQRIYCYTVARVLLPLELPHMLLLNKKAHAELQRDMADKQDLQLEGDFDDYFKLQIEQGQQIDVLTIITPDVMQTLVQYSQAEDIEILGHELFFILNLDKRDLVHVQQLIESVTKLSGQIIENISQEHQPLLANPGNLL